MDESVLECYFDKFITNDSPRTQEQVSEEVSEEVFFRLLPDELLTWDDAAVNTWSPDSSSSLDYSSQNSSAGAELTWASSSSEVQASPVKPVTPVVPEILKEEIPKLVPVICNVLSTVNLGCRLDLDILARRMWNVEYRPETFRGLIIRNREPRATATIFPSGKMTCTGTKSVAESRLVARKFARKLQKLGFPVRFLNFKIQNLVATCRAFPLNLGELQKVHRQHCSYEPELFGGLFYEWIPGITVIIFPSGSITLCGAKSPAEVYEVFETIDLLLRDFRKQ